VHHLTPDRDPALHHVLEALRRLRLLQEGEQLSDVAQGADGVGAHPQRHAARRAEQVREHRNRVPFRLLEEDRGTARAQHAVADLGHLEARIHLGGNALQLAELLELGDEVAQIVVTHAGSGAGRAP